MIKEEESGRKRINDEKSNMYYDDDEHDAQASQEEDECKWFDAMIDGRVAYNSDEETKVEPEVEEVDDR